MPRHDNRNFDAIRPLTFVRNFTQQSAGSVLISSGATMVLCTASIVDELPRWKKPDSQSGWLTAEYRMLPSSTLPRQARGERPDGRATEIQRLIGRALRAVTLLDQLGPRTIYIDCEVLQADGGTRTAAINGAYLALIDALRTIFTGELPLADSVAAMSVGLVEGEVLLDLDYREDVAAAVDMNVVMTGSGRFIEVQGSGEESTFTQEEFFSLLSLARRGIEEVIRVRNAVA